MRWFARGPEHVPLAAPRPDGTGWPDRSATGRASFEAATFAELAGRHAFDVEAHAVADRLVADLLPRVVDDVPDEDEPYLRKVLLTAARIGAGTAVVERTLPVPPPGSVDRRIAAALHQARQALPAMPPHRQRQAGYFLLAGFAVGRGGPDVVDALLAGLDG